MKIKLPGFLKKRLITFLLISVGIFCLGCVLNFSGAFDYIEHKAYDARMNFTSRYTVPDDNICFVGVDQYSIDSLLQERGYGWPWPRSVYSEIVDFFNEAGAKCVAFDVFFTEPSVYKGSDDTVFAQSCAQFGKVVQVMFDSKNSGGQVFPIKPLRNSAAMIANITSLKDSDDIIRRARLSFSTKEGEYPSLGIAPVLLDLPPESVQAELGKIKKEVPSLKDGSVLLRYKGSIDRYPHYSAYDILRDWNLYKNGQESELVPADFEDAVIFFILYAPGLYDICSTPVSQVYPGAGVHMTLLDNYLNGEFLHKIPLWAQLLVCLVLSFASSFTVYGIGCTKFRGRNPLMIFLVTALVLLTIVFSTVSFAAGIYVPLTCALFCIVAGFVACLFFSYTSEGKQRRFIKSAFSQYLSPAVVDRLINDPSKLELGGEKRHITIFFSDIQSFTSISEPLEPGKLTDLLNRYLTLMTDIILESGGTIDKYEGDAIIAFWNAPVDVNCHARVAVEAAIKCQKAIEEKAEEFSKIAGRPLLTRIGLNTGDAIVGNMGSRQRFDYTMLGDSVNLASRLEGFNKQFGTYLMCSETTVREASREGCPLYFRELARAVVVGKKEPVVVFEPVERAVFLQRKIFFESFDRALHLFYDADFVQAQKIFSELSVQDEASARYAAKCSEFMNSAPSMDWHGEWKAAQK